MASTSRRSGWGEEEFIVDLLAKIFGYGCAWLAFCLVAVGTAWAIGMIILIARMISD